ncbi:hypothetical protein QGN29_05955 [Temperatibacter marinus]|uniref:Lipoprotein n=1 Tax=Temperatibacter marinus TaxID=1456591 RepID=A0AA52EFS3_9PROT|nr:hypothetical protein [Temperatibacter marinus]WND03915.1 hypothetical protein QGN29_05955 [Temperatibacter marinus]
MKQVKSIIALCSLLYLSACQVGGAGPSIRSEKIASPLKSALCAKDPAAALSHLNQASDTPVNNLFAAVALTQGGKHLTARQIFADLARSNDQSGINLSCLSLAGTVSSVAADQLVMLQQILVQHDVKLVAEKPLHSGLDPVKPTQKKAAKQTLDRDQQAAALLRLNTQITTPASATMAGTWFSHFASYFSEDKATAAVAIFEERYKPLKGVIGIWTVQSNRGIVWRVGVPADEWSDTDRLCVTIRAVGDYCKVIDRLQ